MTEFKLSPAYFSQFRRRTLLASITLALIACATGIWISVAQSKSTKGLMFVGPVALICGGIGLRNGWRRQIELFEGFRIRVTDDSNMREMPGVPSFSIARSDITRIERDPSGVITIHGSHSAYPLSTPPLGLQERDYGPDPSPDAGS
jgi:hypothetical protein